MDDKKIFKVVSEFGIGKFQNSVNKAIELGYKPIGGVSIAFVKEITTNQHGDLNDVVLFAQSLMKEESK